MAEKRIETVEMRAGDVKTGFGNPRKITKKKKDELRNSIETFGDFGSFIIDENDNIIGGNMRLSVIKEMDPDTVILCKADTYYSGTGAKAYHDEERYRKNGINLVYSDYQPVVYQRKYKPFLPNMSVIDYIFNAGFRIPEVWL